MAPEDDGFDAGGAERGAAPGPERLRTGGSSTVRALLRSAEVDVPSPLARARAQVAAERALEAPPSEPPPRRSRADLALAALGGAGAALLGVWLWSVSGDEQAASGPEPSSAAPSQVGAARPAPACPKVGAGSGREPSIEDARGADTPSEAGIDDVRSIAR